jgi:hypothetical protein
MMEEYDEYDERKYKAFSENSAIIFGLLILDTLESELFREQLFMRA